MRRGREGGVSRIQGRGGFKSFGVPREGAWKIKGGRIRIMGIGWIRFKKNRELSGGPKAWTITGKNGGWHPNVVVRRVRSEPPPEGGPAGIDPGAANHATTSEGERIHMPRGKAPNARIRVPGGKPAGAGKGSRRREKTKAELARARPKRANMRLDDLHKVTIGFARGRRVVVAEELEVGNMTKSAKGTREAP